MPTIRPALSFRAKLLLAMMLVVIGVSVATLLITQRRVQATYEKAFRNQFEDQISYFTSLQEARLSAVQTQCLRLTRSVRLIATMTEPEIDVEDLYQTASDELRDIIGEMAGDSQVGLPVLRRLRATFFRFLDGTGRPLAPPRLVRVPRTAGQQRQFDREVRRLRGILAAERLQQLGYLVIPKDAMIANLGRQARGGQRDSGQVDAPEELLLHEIIVTKIIDPVDGRTVGALVLGFPVPDLIPQARSFSGEAETESRQAQKGAIKSGLLLNEKLYAPTGMISTASSEIVAARVVERIQSTEKARSDFNLALDDGRYWVFYELLNQDSAFPPAYQVCLYSIEGILREQRDLRWWIIGSGGAALLGGVLLSALLSHGLTVPIRGLEKGMAEVRQGNLKVRVPVRSRDEVGRLTESFNEMTEGLALKEKYRSFLSMMTDKGVADELVHGRINLAGELREVSVLFCDIRGFTALTQGMNPQDVVQMLNEHMTVLTRVVYEHDGVVDKFVGDLIMAVFGAPKNCSEDTCHAARCALRMVQERGWLNETSRHRIEIGVGIATGTVLAGGMGSKDRLDYTVIGERVNLASRLCGKAAPGEVWIDQTTKDKLDGVIRVEPATEFQLKGFALVTQAYKLVEIRSAQPTVKLGNDSGV